MDRKYHGPARGTGNRTRPGLGKGTGLRDHVLLITGYPAAIQTQLAGIFHRSGPVHREELWGLRITGRNFRSLRSTAGNLLL